MQQDGEQQRKGEREPPGLRRRAAGQVLAPQGREAHRDRCVEGCHAHPSYYASVLILSSMSPGRRRSEPGEGLFGDAAPEDPSPSPSCRMVSALLPRGGKETL